MTKTVLVSGSDARVGELAEALRAAGAQVVAVDDLDRMEEAVAGLPEGALQGYVQLPVSVALEGDSVVGRVRSFLEQGLLSRFDAVRTVLPALDDAARVLLVSGNTPTGGGRDLPDDRAARTALLEVLSHALRADRASSEVRVHVVDQRPVAELADLVLREVVPVPADVAELRRREVDLSYDDWRTEVLGMATVEV